MPTIRLRSLAFLLLAGAAGLSAADPDKTGSATSGIIDRLSAKHRLVDLLEGAGLYRSPEFPSGCLEWSDSPKGDSLLFRPVMSSKPACSGLGLVEDVWILPPDGATAFLVDGDHRTDLQFLTRPENGRPGDGRALELLEKLQGDLLEGEDVDPSEPNMIDVILAGGGGSIKKREHVYPEPQRTPGAQAGFGMGEGGKRQGQTTPAAVRARISPAKASDIELSGEGAHSRSPESILRVIRQYTGSFQYTYQKFLRNDPGLGGKLSLKFTIAPGGDIVAVTVVRSNTGNAELDDEIRDKARRMKFGKVEGGNLTVTYHFTLDRN